MLIKSYKVLRDHQLTRHAAALSYYLFMSLTSLFLITWLLFDLIVGSDAFKARVIDLFEAYSGEAVAESLSILFFSTSTQGYFAGGIFGFLLLIFSASMGYSHLQNSLDEILTGKRRSGLIRSIKDRLASIFFLFLMIFVALVIIMLSTIFSFAVNLGFLFVEYVALFSIVNFIISFIVVYVVFVLIYRYLTVTKLSYGQVKRGSLFATVLFVLGKYLFEAYFFVSNISTVYGITGYFIVFLLYLYFISLITLFGAVFIRVTSSNLFN